MAAARKQMPGGDVKSGAGERPLSSPNHDEAVLRVQEWDEALKCSYFPLCMPWVVFFLKAFSLSLHTTPTRKVSSRANGPTRRNRVNDPQHMSPTPMPVDAIPSSSSGNSLLTVRKPGSAPTTKNNVGGSYGFVEKIQPLALASPEEQIDNWDDDFEEDISLSKLQGKQGLAGV